MVRLTSSIRLRSELVRERANHRAVLLHLESYRSCYVVGVASQSSPSFRII